jgi:hypothetical protein
MATNNPPPPPAEPIQQLYQALAAFQQSVSAAPKDSKNPHFKNTYASLASVLAAIQPACEHGLSHSVTFEESADGAPRLVTTLHHTAGATIKSVLPIGFGADWQKNGSAISYARRYSLMALYGLAGADDDDDAQQATAAPVRERRPAPRPTPAPAPTAGPDPARVLADVTAAVERSALTLTGKQALIHQLTNGEGSKLADIRPDWLEKVPMVIVRPESVDRLNAGCNSKTGEPLGLPGMDEEELPATWAVAEVAS